MVQINNHVSITKTEYKLLQYLALSLHPSGSPIQFPPQTDEEWKRLLALADCHEILPLIEDGLEQDNIPEEQRRIIQLKTAKTVHKGIQLQVLNSRLTALLEKAGIIAVTMKGSAVARFYPVPEYRKTTDLDLFIASANDVGKAVRILKDNGFAPSGKWHANHHIVLVSGKNEVVELHTTWAEAFKEKHLNQYLERCQKESAQHVHLVEWQGFYLLIHMLQHFVGSGFGLRNLCDWVVLWENCDEEKARRDFWEMSCESGTAEFAKAITAICVRYLGLNPKKSPVPAEHPAEQDVTDALLRDILDAGEFGYSEAERMVGMEGNSLAAYVREFHHQMHINFPKAGRIAVFWPVLWVATLVRFLRNNKKLNRAPISAIMKKAGERGTLVKRLTSYEE